MNRFQPYKLKEKKQEEKLPFFNFFDDSSYLRLYNIRQKVFSVLFQNQNPYAEIDSGDKNIKLLTKGNPKEIKYYFTNKLIGTFTQTTFNYIFEDDLYKITFDFYDNDVPIIKNILLECNKFYQMLAHLEDIQNYTEEQKIILFNSNNINESITFCDISFDIEGNVISYVIHTTYHNYSYPEMICKNFIKNYFDEIHEIDNGENIEFNNYGAILELALNTIKNNFEGNFEDENLEEFIGKIYEFL